MKKLLLTILCFISVMVSNGRTVGEYFGDTRADGVFDMLSSVMRLDMIDYYDSGMKMSVKNDMQGQSRLLSLTDTMLTMRYGSDVEVTVVKLEAKSPVLMVIETLQLPEVDSHVSFYDDRWQPLKRSLLPELKLADWLTTRDADAVKEVKRVIPFMTSEIKYVPENGVLTFISTIKNYYAGEAPQALNYIKPSLSFRWTGDKFVMIR